MARPRLDPDHKLTPAERARRYRQRHHARLDLQRRQKRHGIVLTEGQVHIRLTQLDGVLPNLALMKLASFHRERGDHIHFSRSPYRSPTEPHYDSVYGSAIFSYSASRVQRFKAEFPDAILGGTWDPTNSITVEDVIGEHQGLDYSLWPDFTASLGFTQRGCRMKCGFCVVPKKEGKPASVNVVADIWRGRGHPKHLHLLDNDFFGQPTDQWQLRIDEIRRGRFKVCFNQGINVRLITEETAAALASVHYTDDQFSHRRLYTAWDNLGDEARFFRGVDILAAAGIPPSHLMAYMLIGYDRREDWARVLYRFHRMADIGIRPYPMPFKRALRLPVEGTAVPAGRTLMQFQRWAIRRHYTVVPFHEYDPGR
jgi:hypothetical protein